MNIIKRNRRDIRLNLTKFSVSPYLQGVIIKSLPLKKNI